MREPHSDTITTVIKRGWFAEIVAGRKHIEYRDITPNWTRRLRKLQMPFRLVLRNGMLPPVPVVTVRIDRVVPVRSGPHRGQYALHIERVLRVEHWDRRRQQPR